MWPTLFLLRLKSGDGFSGAQGVLGGGAGEFAQFLVFLPGFFQLVLGGAGAVFEFRGESQGGGLLLFGRAELPLGCGSLGRRGAFALGFGFGCLGRGHRSRAGCCPLLAEAIRTIRADESTGKSARLTFVTCS